jgi:thiamine pyrophosphokinase
MKKYKRAVLFANGDFPENDMLSLNEDDFLVAVDGGLRHLLQLGLTPQLLIGDLDSVYAENLDRCMQWGIEILRFPPEKDETDLELAVREALQRGFSEIVITCALGNRLDHTLGNLALLTMPELKNFHVLISHGSTSIHFIDDHIDLETYPGALISLLPWGEPARGVTTAGLSYALSDATLYPWKTRGLSNVATSAQASVTVKSGRLLLFHFMDQKVLEEKEQDV